MVPNYPDEYRKTKITNKFSIHQIYEGYNIKIITSEIVLPVRYSNYLSYDLC